MVNESQEVHTGVFIKSSQIGKFRHSRYRLIENYRLPGEGLVSHVYICIHVTDRSSGYDVHFYIRSIYFLPLGVSQSKR